MLSGHLEQSLPPTVIISQNAWRATGGELQEDRLSLIHPKDPVHGMLNKCLLDECLE